MQFKFFYRWFTSVSELKNLFKISLAVLAIITVLAAGFYFLIQMRSDDTQVRAFAKSSNSIHNERLYAELFDDFDVYYEQIEAENLSSYQAISAQVEGGVRHGLDYHDHVNSLSPTDGTLDLFDSLTRETDLITGAYSSLSSCLQARLSSDIENANLYLEQARQEWQAATDLRSQNSLDISALLSSTK